MKSSHILFLYLSFIMEYCVYPCGSIVCFLILSSFVWELQLFFVVDFQQVSLVFSSRCLTLLTGLLIFPSCFSSFSLILFKFFNIYLLALLLSISFLILYFKSLLFVVVLCFFYFFLLKHSWHVALY